MLMLADWARSARACARAFHAHPQGHTCKVLLPEAVLSDLLQCGGSAPAAVAQDVQLRACGRPRSHGLEGPGVRARPIVQHTKLVQQHRLRRQVRRENRALLPTDFALLRAQTSHRRSVLNSASLGALLCAIAAHGL